MVLFPLPFTFSLLLVLPLRAFFVSAEKVLGDESLAVDDGTHVSDLDGVVPRPAMPDLVVEHVDVARFRDQGYRLPAFKGRNLAVVRVSAGVVATECYGKLDYQPVLVSIDGSL